MKRIIATLCATAALAGCSSVPGRYNVLLTTISGDRAFVASLYSGVGITAELRKEDARELQAMREKAAAVDALTWSPPASRGVASGRP